MINTETPDTLLSFGSGLHRSLDGGQSWSEVDQNIPLAETQEICDVAVTESDFEYIYAGICGNNGGALYRSRDLGSNCVQVEDTSGERLQYSVTHLSIAQDGSNDLFVGTGQHELLYTADA